VRRVHTHLGRIKTSRVERSDLRGYPNRRLYFAGDYNLRGRTPKADVDVCFTP
jgi:hypothetical protein